jgi:hypothetical protein
MNGLQQLEKPNIIWVVLGEQDDFMKKGNDEERLRQNCFFTTKIFFTTKMLCLTLQAANGSFTFFP